MNKILLIAPSAYILGGVQTWLDYLLPGLESKGWDATLGLVSGHFHDVDKYLNKHPLQKFISLDNPTGSAEGRVVSITDALEIIKPDLVVSVNIPSVFPSIERLRYQGKQAPKLVMTNHSVEHQYLLDLKNWSHVIDSMIGTNRLTCSLANRIAHYDNQRILYAQYGVHQLSKPHPRIDLKQVPFIIAYSGRLDIDQKRANDIPEILSELDKLQFNYKLLVAGSGPYEEELRNRLSTHILDGKVEFLGFIPHEKLQEVLYDQADCLLMTSFWETGPIVIWEAMSCGLPVVTTRYIGSGLESSLKQDLNCLMYDYDDASQAAIQIVRLSDINLRRTLSCNGHKLIDDRYSIRKSVEAWDQCFKRVMMLPDLPKLDRPSKLKPSGRLDRLFGNTFAEHLRKSFGIEFKHTDPGGEWPHCLSDPCTATINSNDYWKLASSLDKSTQTYC